MILFAARPSALRPERLGRALRGLRLSRGLKQYQAAEKAGITKAMLSAYETGKRLPSLRTLANYLHALDATLGDLRQAIIAYSARSKDEASP